MRNWLVQSLRPDHYKEGEDTWAWAEKRFTVQELRAIAEFNIHKYSNRSKGQDVKDFGKVADYSLWIAGILTKHEEAQKPSKPRLQSTHKPESFKKDRTEEDPSQTYPD